MDKKTLKVIEKYSMPFVQLVIEKGEEDSIFSDLSQIKQVAEEIVTTKRLVSFSRRFKQSAITS